MPPGNKNEPAPPQSRASLRAAWWGCRLICDTVPRLAAGLLLLTLVRGVVPAGMAVVARALVNGTVRVIEAPTPDFQPLLPWLLFGLGLTLAEGLGSVFARYGTHRLYDDLNLQVTTRVLEHAATLDLAFFEDRRRRELIDRAQQDIADRLTQFFSNVIVVLTSSLQAASLVVILVAIEPLIVIVLGPFALPYLFFHIRIARRKYREQYRRTTNRRWTAYFVEHLTSHERLPEVRLFGLTDLLTGRFRNLLKSFRDRDREFYRRSALAGSVFAVLSTVTFYILFARTVRRAVLGGLSVGDVAIFGGATARLRIILERLLVALGAMTEQALYIGDLRAFLAVQPRSGPSRGKRLGAPRGEVVFDRVSFTYPGTDTPVLRDLSFKIEAGETVAIVGENGAGKTTVTKLLARFYDPDSGRILLDGHDLRELDRDDLRAHLSYIMQRFGKYEATLAENIAYGDRQRLVGQPDLVAQVGDKTGIGVLADTLPDGYDTHIGRLFGRAELSEGQWQRIAAARALARDASLWVLDEPAAHLDARAEWELFNRFRALSKGRTTILISHRLMTLGMADRILVLDKGSIAESGSHEALLDSEGRYAELFRLQSRMAGRMP